MHYAVTVTNMLFESRAKAEEYASFLGESVIEVPSRLAWAKALQADGVDQVQLPDVPASRGTCLSIEAYIDQLQIDSEVPQDW